MICPICHNKVVMTMREMERVLAPHPYSSVVLQTFLQGANFRTGLLHCPGSNRTSKEALDIAKADAEEESK